jgi:hypothetical protein
MAAVAALTVTDKRSSAAALVVNDNAIYTRTVVCTTDAGSAGGPVNLTGLIIPKNTMIMSFSMKFSVAQGSCTFLLTAGAALNTTTAYNHTNHAIPTAVVPRVTTADTQVTYTTASAVTVAAEWEITFVLCAIGQETPRSTAVGN